MRLQERSSSCSEGMAHRDVGNCSRSLSDSERDTRLRKITRSLIQPMDRG